MKYMAHLEQASEGCDYTIGCGTLLISLKATTHDAAVEELRRIISEGYISPEMRLEDVRLLRVDEVTPMPVKAWYREVEDIQAGKRRQAEDARERAEYERLRQKFG